jgi:alpha-glucoside transport system substrate-binding protein
MRRRYLLLGLLALFVPFLVASCGGGDDEEAAPPPAEPAPAEPAPAEPAPAETAPAETEPAAPAEEVSGDISIMGIWVAEEQESFEAVLDGFREQFPDVSVRYDPAGDDLVTVLSTAIEGGNPPDLAAPAQPGFIADLARRGELQPIDFMTDLIQENFGESGVALGSVDDTLYSLFFKANNKSTVWYNVPAFEDAGVTPPETWEDLATVAQTLLASGVPAYSIGGADGWTLTDLFENIYIRTAGPDLYDQLSNHEIPWTDQSVKDALAVMAEIVGDAENIAGGTEGALQTDFPTSVTQAFADPPAAAMVIEADFVAGEILASTQAEAETGFNVFDFPSINDSPPATVVAGNFVVMLNDNPAARALLEYLASPEAAEIWAARGGFSSPNQAIDTSVYPDPITEATAGALAEAEVSRFDLSDLQPSEFGGTVGQGLFKLFQDFLANPDDIDGITQQMEDAAAAAFG